MSAIGMFSKGSGNSNVSANEKINWNNKLDPPKEIEEGLLKINKDKTTETVSLIDDSMIKITDKVFEGNLKDTNINSIKDLMDSIDNLEVVGGDTSAINQKLDSYVKETELKEIFYNKDLNSISPAVVFITDDGSLSDSKLEKISKEKNVPFVSAVYKDCPNKANLKHLQDDLGWEIVGHHNNNLTLETQTYEAIKAKFQETIDFCKKYGINIKNHVYANGGHNPLIRKVASELFNCAVQVGGGINVCPVTQFNLNRVSMGSYFDAKDITKQNLDTSSLEYYKAVVDKAIDENGFVLFMLHPSHSAHTDTQDEYIASTIDYIKSKNVDILTLQQAIDRFGNKKINGDYFGKDADNYYVEGADGQIINKLNGVNLIKLNNLALNSKKADDNISTYPKGLSICEISLKDQGFPSTQGTLITYRYSSADILSWQMFKPNAVSRINTRAVKSDGTWTDFSSSTEKQGTIQTTLEIGTIKANSNIEKTVEFAGATLNDNVIANAYTGLNGGVISESCVKQGGVVSIRLYNISDNDINVGNKKFNITVIKK